MKRLFICLILAIGLILLSCTNEEMVSTQSSGGAVSFGVSSITSKGTALEQDELLVTGFGVSAFSTTQEWVTAKSEATPNFMYDQKVVYLDNTWTYSPLVYWNNFESHSFFAYAPYQSDAIELSGSDYVGTPTITYSVSDDPREMIDMVSDQLIDKSTDDTSLQYNFNHQLTRLNLTADVEIASNADAYVVISNLHIKSSSDMYTKGVYTFPDDDTEYGEWKLDETSKISTDYPLDLISQYDNNTQELKITDESNLFTSGEYLFLLPVNGTAGLSASDSFEIGFNYSIMLYDAVAEDYLVYVTKESSISMPTGTLAQGESYSYKISFKVTSVEFSGTADNWANPDRGSINYPSVQEVEVGESIALEFSYTDDYNGEKVASWGTEDSSKVSVDNGTITGVSVTGDDTVTITAYDSEGNVLFETEVTVTQYINYINSVSTSSSTMTCTEELSSYALSATVGYTDSSDNKEEYTLTWSSSDTSVATISTSGALTTVANGTTTITVTATGSISGVAYSDTMTVTVSAYDESLDYSKISVGMYVNSSGEVSSSSSGAVAVVYYVGSDYALAVYKSSSYRIYQWCPSSYTSTSVSASSQTDGWSNTQAMIAKFGSTSSTTNPAAWANSKGTIAALYDGKGKGQYYLPSRNEMYVLLAACKGKYSYSVESSSNYPDTITGTGSGSVYSKVSSLFSKAEAFVSSTQSGTNYCQLMYTDLSGWSKTNYYYKSTLCYSTSSSAYSNSYSGNTLYYAFAIIKI